MPPKQKNHFALGKGQSKSLLSGKRKKEIQRESRKKKSDKELHGLEEVRMMAPDGSLNNNLDNTFFNDRKIISHQPSIGDSYCGDKRSKFKFESNGELNKRFNESLLPIKFMKENNESFYPSVDSSTIGEFVKFPIRPKWRNDMTAEEINISEASYFAKFKEELTSSYGIKRVNNYELNLQVWRQLWRVIERSDILLILCDIRCPVSKQYQLTGRRN